MINMREKSESVLSVNHICSVLCYLCLSAETHLSLESLQFDSSLKNTFTIIMIHLKIHRRFSSTQSLISIRTH